MDSDRQLTVDIEVNSDEAIGDLEAVRDTANEAAEAVERLDAVLDTLDTQAVVETERVESGDRVHEERRVELE